jgi:hypothetical protein
MSAEDNLSVTLFRGLSGIHPNNINTKEIGMHWTKNSEIATDIAHGVYPGVPFDNSDYVPSHNVVLEAKVPKNAIVKRGTPEHNELADFHEILPYGAEEETTVRPGIPIEATVHHFIHHPRKGGRLTNRKKKIKGIT